MERTKQDIDILNAQINAKLEKLNFCLENINKAAALIEIFVGDKNQPFQFYMTTAELAGFLKSEVNFHNSFLDDVNRYNSPVFA